MSEHNQGGAKQKVSSRIAKVYPLTPMQEGMLFYYMMNPGTTEYCIQHRIRLDRPMDMACVREAARILTLRHDVLRTAFYYRTDKTPQQLILNGKTLEVNELDLRALPDEEREARVQSAAKEDVARGFNLEKDSLVRMTFLHTKDACWQMLFSFHHIIMDGWCTGIVLRDFFTYYADLAAGKTSKSVEEEALREAAQNPAYSDYIRWLKGQDRERAMAYWEHLHSGCDAVGRLTPRGGGYDLPAGAKTVSIAFSQAETQKALAYTKAHNVTMSALVESVWALTLQLFTGSRDIVYGRVVSGRGANLRGIEGILGLFINTVPARATWNADQTLTDFISGMNAQIMEGQSYDFCSLAEIQNRCEFGADMIKSLFVYENYYVDSKASALANDPTIHMEDAREETNYDISATGYMGDTLCFRIMYDPRKFRADELNNVLLSLRQILRAALGSDEVTPAQLETLSARDMLFMLRQNETWVDCPLEETVVRRLETIAAREPERTALVLGDEYMSYGELNARANMLAKRLRALGIGPDDRVAVLARRGFEMFVAIWGALKAGAGYVPISPSYTLERKRFILNDSGAKALLQALAELECETSVPILNVTLSKAEQLEENPPLASQPENLAYVIYTSGTTGNPKGVMLEHRNLTHFMNFCTAKFSAKPEIVMPFFTNYCFDLTIHTLFFPLFTGGRVVIFSDESNVLEAFGQYDKYRFTAVKLTPEHVKMLLAADLHADMGEAVFVAGGEQLLADVARRAVQNFGGRIRFFNEYGPTECTVGSTYHLFDPGQTANEVTIGTPFDRVQVYIMQGGLLVGVDQPGEMCIAGAGVARGYLNRDELNASKFVPNPFGPGRLYRTGDLARWNGDGQIDYLGRMDDQVKIRGYRIEPGEIVGALRRIEGVENAAVVPRVDAKGDKELYAYVVSPAKLDIKQLRFALSKLLPDYMLPAHMMQLDRIPLTPNGKTDKRALPDIEDEPSEQAYIPPENETEKIVADTFAQILGLERVSRTDNFFALGGHSLRATRAVNRIEALSGVRVPLRDLFAFPTPEALAKRIQALSGQFSHIPKAPVSDTYPMSGAQKRMYLIMQVSGDTVGYNIPSIHEVCGEIDAERLRGAMQTLIDRHEILRTAFLMENGAPVQKILPHCDASLRVDTTDARTPEEIEAELRRFIRPFDLSAPPLIRAELLKRGDGTALFLLDSNIHEQREVVFFNGNMAVPYLELEELFKMLTDAYDDDPGYQLTTTYGNHFFIATRENGEYVLIDYEDGAILFSDYDMFGRSASAVSGGDILATNTWQMNEDGSIKTDENGVRLVNLFKRQDIAQNFTRHGYSMVVPVALSGIPIYWVDDKGYLPITTFADLFMAPVGCSWIYNGQALFLTPKNGFDDNVQNDEGKTLKDIAFDVPDGNRSVELAEYTYREMVLMLEGNYGLRDEHAIGSDFDQYLDAIGLKDRMLMQSGAEFCDALGELMAGYFGDLHSGLNQGSPFAGADYHYDLGTSSNTSLSFASSFNSTKRFAVARRNSSCVDDEGKVIPYQEVKDTAYISFDSFYLGNDRNYYDPAVQETFQDIMGEDNIALIHYANEQINRADSPIKNVVIDLSVNSGGMVDAGFFVASWVLGSCNFSTVNPMSKAQYTVGYQADVDLDGYITDADHLDLSKFKVCCMISNNSFSCGNLVPALFKESGAVALLGQQSGGGACAVEMTIAADGTVYQYSSRYRLSTVKNGSYYSIDQGVAPDFSISDPNHMYDRQWLTDFIGQLP